MQFGSAEAYLKTLFYFHRELIDYFFHVIV